MSAYLWIALGSALGGMLRFGLGRLVHTWADTGFPWGTLAVNLLGCFCIGMIAPLVDRDSLGERLIVIGVLGGFTTFSAFTWQTCELIAKDRIGPAAGYVAASVLLCLFATWLGWRLVRGPVG